MTSVRFAVAGMILYAFLDDGLGDFLTGAGVRSMADWPTASTGEPCGEVSPAASWAAPIATAAASTPATAPASGCGAREWSPSGAGADVMAEVAARRPSTLPAPRVSLAPRRFSSYYRSYHRRITASRW